MMQIQLLRHATFVLHYGGQILLVDPMLSPKDTMDPVGNASNQARIPMVELPVDETGLRQIIDSLTGLIVTHTHRDHWDDAAIQQLPKNLPLICQPPDEEKMRSAGFTEVLVASDPLNWEGISLHRTGGQHGKGKLRELMGPVSGFVLKHPDEPTLYIAGDTIWCEEVEEALQQYQMDTIVLNAGGAQFLEGDPITMTTADIMQVHQAAPQATILPVHMDTINHCLLTREKLRVELPADLLENQTIQILEDGETR